LGWNGYAMPANSNKKWTPEVDKRLLDLRAAGKSTFAIAAELRRSITSVRGRLSILKAKGRLASSSDAIHSTPRRKRWTIDDDQRLMDLRAKGASFNEIAIALGRTEAALEQRAHNLKRQAASHYLDAGLTPSRFEP
jgi:hypothetical protein